MNTHSVSDPPTPPRVPSRRAAAGRALAAGALMLGAACATAASSTDGSLRSAAPSAQSVRNQLWEPRRVASVNGVLDVELWAVMDSLDVPLTDSTSSKQYLRAYQLYAANGDTLNDPPRFPGPTFVVNRGDSVRILLRNKLPPDGSENQCMNYPAANAGLDTMQGCFHGPNWTNIHYHGFHVTPDSVGDDVLLLIGPGQSHQYAFGIPDNQSPGTHWYHPHKHGSVAIQVSNGMSGAFIVQGSGIDSLSAGMREHLIAVQKIDSAVSLQDAGALNPVNTINGQITPVIVMRPNEVQRWRVVNENITRTANFQIGFINEAGKNEPTMYDIARDGVSYAPANYNLGSPDTLMLMAPGNRLDVWVKAPPEPGIYHLAAATVALPARGFSRQQDEMARAQRIDPGALTASPTVTSTPKDTLFYVQVVDDGTPPGVTSFPASLPPLPPFLANLPGVLDSFDPDTVPLIVFKDSVPPSGRSVANPSQFWLGTATHPNMRFNDTIVYVPQTASGTPKPMVLGGRQTWIVANYGTTTNHPFHIHINPFQVARVVFPRGARDPNAALYEALNNAASAGFPIWLDVLALPLPQADSTGRVQPGYIVIRQEYADFSGQYVMHCHILGHEERGMMQLLQVNRPGDPSPGAAGHAHHH
ncbi:MAG: multicopper oxidase domain-containing protein [Gemmatimonadetes bacterium]|nr:multicopper oxidase domain-containing protein [Gemmatimonadota bacterium]